ncbi:MULTISPECIES: DUF5324 family protein [unclassified Streptomyces]|uniref:DUF5324 family protein n=1 Tax=unclassified Streptomyces TaxID=2593676 RepID=UPI000B87E14F|nr:DUF5324 family protein [Streptomyces sp. DvalAA-14]MYS21202.1 transcriptional regulator [Streptomyces sp. SID4948]
MTRIDSVRHAADVTKDSVRHAAEVAAPYTSTAKDGAVHYGRQAGVYGRQVGAMAKQQYDAKLADRVEQVVEQVREQAAAAVPPKAANVVETAAKRTRKGAKAAAEYTAPKVGTAVAATRAAAGPAKDEVVLRGGAALHALRGQVSAADIDRLVRRRTRRAQTGRVFRGLVIVGLAGGAAVAAFKWWSKQSNPDWLVEPSQATDPLEDADTAAMNGSGTLTVVDPLEETLADESGSVTGSVNGSVNGSNPDRVDGLDPEVEAKQADADHRDDER